MQVWKAFVAYQELLVASEYLGRERAMGVIFYTLGEFPTREEYLYFVESQDTSNASFAAARQYSLIAREIYDAKIKVNKNKEQCPLFHFGSNIFKGNGTLDRFSAIFTREQLYDSFFAVLKR